MVIRIASQYAIAVEDPIPTRGRLAPYHPSKRAANRGTAKLTAVEAMVALLKIRGGVSLVTRRHPLLRLLLMRGWACSFGALGY